MIVIVAAIALAARSNQEAKKLRQQIRELEQQAQQQGQGQATEAEIKKLAEEVGRLIVLPEGENPTVATITDKEKLGEVPFFSKAENGDKVLIYVNARKAYLYRPSAAKVIEVAALNLSATSPTPTK